MSPIPVKKGDILAECCISCSKKKSCSEWCQKALDEFTETIQRAKSQSRNLERGEQITSPDSQKPPYELLEPKKQSNTHIDLADELGHLKALLNEALGIVKSLEQLKGKK